MPTFTTNVEPITFRTAGGPSPDPKWKFTDSEGHEHSAYPESPDRPTWPTLKWVVDETYWCETCRDEHESGHHECAVCGETIEPGMVMKPPETMTRPGLVERFIDDVPVTKEIWDRALAIVRRAEAQAEVEVAALVESEGFSARKIGYRND